MSSAIGRIGTTFHAYGVGLLRPFKKRAPSSPLNKTASSTGTCMRQIVRPRKGTRRRKEILSTATYSNPSSRRRRTPNHQRRKNVATCVVTSHGRARVAAVGISSHPSARASWSTNNSARFATATMATARAWSRWIVRRVPSSTEASPSAIPRPRFPARFRLESAAPRCRASARC